MIATIAFAMLSVQEVQKPPVPTPKYLQLNSGVVISTTEPEEALTRALYAPTREEFESGCKSAGYSLWYLNDPQDLVIYQTNLYPLEKYVGYLAFLQTLESELSGGADAVSIGNLLDFRPVLVDRIEMSFDLKVDKSALQGAKAGLKAGYQVRAQLPNGSYQEFHFAAQGEIKFNPEVMIPLMPQVRKVDNSPNAPTNPALLKIQVRPLKKDLRSIENMKLRLEFDRFMFGELSELKFSIEDALAKIGNSSLARKGMPEGFSLGDSGKTIGALPEPMKSSIQSVMKGMARGLRISNIDDVKIVDIMPGVFLEVGRRRPTMEGDTSIQWQTTILPLDNPIK